jgi:dipeptidyl aminopeptidase/acylaminoacyl peptidase
MLLLLGYSVAHAAVPALHRAWTTTGDHANGNVSTGMNGLLHMQLIVASRAALRSALILGACLAADASRARDLILDDYYRVHTIAEPQISPRGDWVVYSVSTPDPKADADDSDVWLASWDGRQSLRLTNSAASEHSPRWSPDGEHIAFLTDRADKEAGDQIWIIDRRGGEARQLSHFDAPISAFAFSPDGSRLVFSAEVPAAKPAADKPAPIVIDRLQFKQDERGYLHGSYRHLFLLDASSGAVSTLTAGAFDEIQPTWSPNGKQIAFLSKRQDEPDADNNWDLYVIDAVAGATPRAITASLATDGDPTSEWSTTAPAFSADGAQVASVVGGAPEDLWYSLTQVSVTDVAPPRTVTPTAALDRNTLDPHWSADGRWIYFRLEDDLNIVLARVRLRDRHIERLSPANGVVNEFDIGPHDVAAVVYSRVDLPTEVFAVEHGRLRALSHHNDAWLREVTLSKASAISAKSSDGLEIRGLMLTPSTTRPTAGFPTLLRLHGGPVGQHQQEFVFAWQWFAANGYAVIAPNPRGSSGRGYQFQKLLFARWGEVDVPDVLAAVDAAVAQGIADPNRLGVGGWSYGSILTNYVITADARFKAATSGAGMSNMLAGYGSDEYIREWELELGLPWEHPELWLKLSAPFLHADRIKTPTLFLGGSADFNVPLVGQEQMYQALRRLHVPTQLVIYPEQFHGLDRPNLEVDRMRRYVEWYDLYLKPR